MQRYFAIGTFVFLVIIVITRSFQMKRAGIKAFLFGKTDKKDFLIPPFAFFLIYQIVASAFSLPVLGSELFADEVVSWIGVALCMIGLLIFILSVISVGKSFRVGIDIDHSGGLITSRVYAISRNPMYTSFGCILLGIF